MRIQEKTKNGGTRPADFLRMRNRAGLSREEAAEKIGVSSNHLWSIEKGRHRPGNATLAAMAKVYGRPLILRFDP